MCTLSIQFRPERLLVTMNRDEAIARAPETPPRIHAQGAKANWIAPHDGEKGGTWMGANDRGLVACLLNYYMPGESLLPDTSGQYRSRGEIIPKALAKGNLDEALAWLIGDFDPAPYPSFSLHLISPQGNRRLTWMKDGKLGYQEIQGEWNVFSSSGWDSEEVTRWREGRFAAWLAEGAPMRGPMPTFHTLQEHGHEERSPLMRREWSATRSITQAVVDSDRGRVVVAYWPDPTPNSVDPEHRAHLPIRTTPERRARAKAR